MKFNIEDIYTIYTHNTNEEVKGVLRYIILDFLRIDDLVFDDYCGVIINGEIFNDISKPFSYHQNTYIEYICNCLVFFFIDNMDYYDLQIEKSQDERWYGFRLTYKYEGHTIEMILM